jgi:uncharacterized SAM-binding protein YcdF (DUF218 family)
MLLRKVKKAIGVYLIIMGSVFMVMCLIAFTRLPFDMHRALGLRASAFQFTPEYIVMMGGGGMPSESNLMRLYHTQQLHKRFPDTEIILAHPTDMQVVQTMKNYLIENGIDSTRILVMLNGTNTREQAMGIKQMLKEETGTRMVVVTSPEHMYRTVRVFRKIGFTRIGGSPAFENAMFVDLSYDHKAVGGKQYVPDISGNLDLRYNFWNYLKLEITCLREYLAIIYYRLNGWI